MKKFSFTLESVLKVKEKLLEDERLKLAHFMSVLNSQKDSLNTMEKTLIRYQSELQELVMSAKVDSILMDSYKSYINKFSSNILAQKELIKKTQQELTLQQQKTKNAYVEVKTLEKLKEKQKENYNKAFLQEEIKMIDDIVSSKRLAI